MTKTIFGISICLAGSLVAGLWTALPAQEFEDVTTVVAIEIPVQVLRDGKPVRGLTAEDFEIFEGRTQHELVAFEEIDLSMMTVTEQEKTETRDNVITEQQQRISRLKSDLRDSVKKTAELRAELSDRAAENVKSEVKLREVETELSVAQASTDMLATGVLDYSVTPDGEDEDEKGSKVKAAT